MIFERAYRSALTNPDLFRRVVRPLLYRRAGGDPEEVHKMAVDFLAEHESLLEKLAPRFDFPDLHVHVAGRSRMPLGTAAGFDKDGDALYPLSLIFGFEEPGTVVLRAREGNPKPRVAVDNSRRELYNAQGFPSLGAQHFLANIRRYSQRQGKAPIFVGISGIPPSPTQVDVAFQEVEALVDSIGPYADGFVWNPFSPNTAALELLRTDSTFRRTAELLESKVGKKAKLVKMGPYEDDPEQRSAWLGLLRAWMQGGGDGSVCVNSYAVPRSQVPSADWGYPSAGRSGGFLRGYRNRALRDAKKEFPGSLVIATGGIDSGKDAWSAFEAGADLVEGYTPYTFEGFGLIIKIAKELRAELRARGLTSLSEFIRGRPVA